jgi:methyl-accepting chemotaxis protein
VIPIIGALLRGIGGAAITSGGRGMIGSGIRFISGLPRLLGEKEGASEPTSDIESMRQSFLERIQAGEEISDDELADAPAGAVPDELFQRRFSARFSRILTAATQPGGVSTPSGSNSAQPAGSAAGPPPPPPPAPPGSAPGQPPSNQPGSGIGAAFSSAISSVSDFAGIAVRATTVVTGLVRGLELMNTGVLSLNRGLSEYEGGLAAAYAQFDADEIQRGVRRAETMSGPLQGLLREQSELKDSISEVSNEISAGFVQLLTGVTWIVNYANKITGITDTISSTVREIRMLFPGAFEEPELTAWQAFLADVSDGKLDGKRPEFGGPREIFNR